MSHFTCLVIGDDHDWQLAPFHEFESTGDDDEFVQEFDKTEEYRAEYYADTETRMRGPGGVLKRTYDAQFFRDPTEEEEKAMAGPFKMPLGTGGAEGPNGERLFYSSQDWGDGKGYRAKVQYKPAGWEEVELPAPVVITFADWIKENHGGKIVTEVPDDRGCGYILVDAQGEVIRAVDRTNPNSHWDWYQVGGRWTGFFLAKKGIKHHGRRGEPGLLTESAKPGWFDSLLKGEIDLEGMRADAERAAAERYDAFAAEMPPDWLTTGKSWTQFREEIEKAGGDLQAARELFREQPFMKAYDAAYKAKRLDFIWDPSEFLLPRDAYLERARRGACVPFAVVKDRVWYERGRMGWWGCVSDEEDFDTWRDQVAKLLDGLPDDTRLTIVDCHI